MKEILGSAAYIFFIIKPIAAGFGSSDTQAKWLLLDNNII
jgi:hypothetical protein